MEELAPQGIAARRLLPFMGGLSGLGALVLASSLAAHLSSRSVGTGATIFAIGAFAAAFLWLWLRNSRLLVGRGVIGQRNLFGQTSTSTTADIDRMLIASVVYSKSSAPQRVLYVLSRDGKVLMALNTRAWGDDAIGKFVEASGKNVEYRDSPISAKEFRDEFPHAVNWAALHPTLMGSLIVVVALGLALGIPIALALSHR